MSRKRASRWLTVFYTLVHASNSFHCVGLMRIQDLFQSLNTRDLLIDLDVRRINSLPVAKDGMGAPAGVDHMSKGDTSQKVFYIMDLEQLDVLGVIRYLVRYYIHSASENVIGCVIVIYIRDCFTCSFQRLHLLQ